MPPSTPTPTPTAASAGRPSKPRVWLIAIRPPTLPAAVGPVLVGLGTTIGNGGFRPLPALLSLLVALVLQIAANLANDLFDHRAGADPADRLGPPRMAASGLLSERELAVGTGLALLAAGLVGLSLVAVGGPIVLVIGALAIAAALAYTGGPWPYGYRGLGEPFVFIFFGPVAVAGTAYLQTGAWELSALAAAVPVGALITAILVVNNLRDIVTDERAGKRTLAVRLGAPATVVEYALLLVVAYGAPLVFVALGWFAPPALLPLVSAPLSVPLLRGVRTAGQGGDRRRLNPVLRGTARLSLAYSVLLALGLGLGGPA